MLTLEYVCKWAQVAKSNFSCRLQYAVSLMMCLNDLDLIEQS
jgi:hypothetical protein